MNVYEKYKDQTKFHLGEELARDLVRLVLPESVQVSCELEEANLAPCVLVVLGAGASSFMRTNNHVQIVDADFWVFVEGTDAKIEGGLICEAMRTGLLELVERQIDVRPGVAFTQLVQLQVGHRETDWAPAVGPVQYADLPQGWERFSCAYRFAFHYKN